MNCLIVDDDVTSRMVLQKLVGKIGEVSSCIACSSTKEAREIIENQRIDLLLLDVEMPEETGIQLMDSLTSKIEVIFITSQRRHAVEAFEKDAVDYIVKPVSIERLEEAVKKVTTRRVGKLSETTNIRKFLFVKEGKLYHKIFISDIDFIEANGSYSCIHTSQKKYMVKNSLNIFEEKLTEDEFIKIHRSFIINVNKVSTFDEKELVIKDEKLPISRSCRKELFERLNII